MKSLFNHPAIVGIILVLVIVISSGGFHSCYSEPYQHQQRQVNVLNFFYDIVSVDSKDPGLSKINIYIKIAYDELQFVVVDSLYRASYEASVVIFNEDREQVGGENLQEQLVADSYEKTNSKELFSLSHLSFDLEPGEYQINIGITDKDTRKTRYQKIAYRVREFGKNELEVSELSIVNNITIDSLGIKSIRPEVASHIKENPRMLYGYYEIYSKREVDSFKVAYSIKNSRGIKIYEGQKAQFKEDERTMAYVLLDAKKISHGNYLLELKVNDGKESAKIKKSFSIRWFGFPSSIIDIDLAIQQLKYIASSSEMKKLKKAADEEKVKEFEKFWKRYDPTPGTLANEHLEEYYRRINYANEVFSGFREGWRSDMGMIYIIFGAPDEIDRHPFESVNKPYEVWYYHEINRRFVFIDETGFGEYRLTTESWQNWQRNYWRP